VRNSIQAIRLLESRSIDVRKLISHRLKLDEFEKAVEILDKGSENVLKVMMVP
jgi:threonine dehydrogenase-like Zn-dependent dehydrogenase